MSYKNYYSENNPLTDEAKTDENEKKIKDNILLIKKNMIYAEENLENLKNNLISKRIIEALHEEIQQIYVKVIETENLFRDWEIKFAENPFEKQKKKYIFEKLNIHFKNEVNKLESISVNVKKAANELPNIENGEMSYSHIKNTKGGKIKNSNMSTLGKNPFTKDNFILHVDEDFTNNDDFVDNDDFIESASVYDYELDHFDENDRLIDSEIATQRFEGIKKIQCQVAQAQEVFKDFAQLVFTQKENIEILNNNIYDANINAFNSAKELKKTYLSVRQQRLSWCLIVITLVIFIYFIYFKLFHLSMFS
ncbi:syntaxin 5, putative [Plasmodium knowlesi strain H]|uniref:Syntaxin 5, putative n=3 Tax=Plasmodium knowlesi TaxID=5850 RepID=A0A5K1VH88_PLAKH|nr:syntaxin 5, putative [Plasmodium knowlesi strain H]OTN66831.1 putative Syntaxin 5 [Plasmodium knowlesi]CAA9990140.1 syntaxin 5, putative [Plasmodium knowlesi strain H]SBO25827.1 syntaxin 5, putative [Plasmodium knowlesi strain H]SBO28613.1 syntaxin 5, putative [Plasmodium knowlesi strain H]VVS79614.1 syntaxin 5, putative [Plasmodium knowlesi strain H]|eukprot:XP_002260607.1 syntaxin 5, putative [Plasmodium knowlesi strain H]